MTGYYLKKLAKNISAEKKEQIMNDWKLQKEIPSILTLTLYSDRYYGFKLSINGNNILLLVPVGLKLNSPRYYIFDADCDNIKSLISSHHFARFNKNLEFSTTFEHGVVDINFVRFINKLYDDGSIFTVMDFIRSNIDIISMANNSNNIKESINLLHKIDYKEQEFTTLRELEEM